jgi:ABC-type nitrate/sulfonate/bicarbonate transport system substrate-binding protein
MTRMTKLLFTTALAAAFCAPASAQTKVRVAWIVPVTNLASFMYTAKDVLRHHGKSYVAEPTRFQGSTPQLTALGTGDLDIALLGFTSFPLAIQNARMEDLRIIADEIRDGVPGYYSNEFMVRKDAGIRSVADLKGKVLSTNAAGSAVDVAMRAMLRKNGLDDKAFTVVEAAFPNMRAMLLEKKAELVPAVPPFAYNPELRAGADVLFTEGQALGPNTLGIWVARAGFLQKNRAAVIDLLEDYLRIVRFVTDAKNQKAAVQLASAATKIPAPALDAWLFTNKDYFRPKDGEVDAGGLQSNMDEMQKLGFLKERVDAKKYVDMSYIREAARRLK